MALPIRSIPVLTSKVAEEFMAKADKAKPQPEISFSHQLASLKRILQKASLPERIS